jgi:uncharacterized protein involved in type VI secretion and phage assembly
MTDTADDLSVQTAEQQRSRFYGKYRGVVTDVDDPDTVGRLKAKVPEVLAEAESPWAMPSVPFAGQGHGTVLIPEVGDGIWMEFEAGDPSRPIWTGCWWASGELPSPGAAKVRVFVTTPGHKWVVDEDAAEITVTHAGGAEVKLTDSEISLKLGGSELTMTSSDITLKSGSGQIQLSASGVSVNQGALEVR